jgi:hypothetical protein
MGVLPLLVTFTVVTNPEFHALSFTLQPIELTLPPLLDELLLDEELELDELLLDEELELVELEEPLPDEELELLELDELLLDEELELDELLLDEELELLELDELLLDEELELLELEDELLLDEELEFEELLELLEAESVCLPSGASKCGFNQRPEVVKSLSTQGPAMEAVGFSMDELSSLLPKDQFTQLIFLAFKKSSQ